MTADDDSQDKKDKSANRQLGDLFAISVAAELAGMHAQTLRQYDRIGLVIPIRTSGGGRRYTRRDVARLRKIQSLSQDEGVNLAGIKAIIELGEENNLLREELERERLDNHRLREEVHQRSVGAGREIVHVPRTTAVVMWKPRHSRR